MSTENIQYTIEKEDVEWEMDWTAQDKNGNRRHPHKPEKEMIFEESGAISLLLLNEIIFLNSNWFEKDWPKEAQESIFMGVLCNDVFAWGCSDSERLPYSEIENLYRFWKRDLVWGSAVWCMIKRKQMPQKPVQKYMINAGWDLEKLKKEYNLRENAYDNISSIMARKKYNAYKDWVKNKNEEPLPFDKNWWAGWDKFIEANPDWLDDKWKLEEDEEIENWKKENGY